MRIGLRVNKLWLVHRWMPMLGAMPRMINGLQRHPQMGCLHAESWLGGTAIMVQYWRGIEQLQAYAHDRTAAHLPAWRRFNRAVGTDGSVGIWNETYLASAANCESIYVNMPPFGLGRAGRLVGASGFM
ncbi:DUF4188 domain-containing protein [Azohydromonas aeria]|uniref:DUF4188 domain-containing protein n=1 Tax=Azohydromonas aeria TaxID=2590212 RepID=UPI0012F73A08|nr:DUF4188 domain-containing protein [Azohydromonas aeria]